MPQIANDDSIMGDITPSMGAVSFFLQGRWWCATCLVQWTGTWEVPDIAPHLPNGQEWAPVHDCGTVMVRTSGDDRACAD